MAKKFVKLVVNSLEDVIGQYKLYRGFTYDDTFYHPVNRFLVVLLFHGRRVSLTKKGKWDEKRKPGSPHTKHLAKQLSNTNKHKNVLCVIDNCTATTVSFYNIDRLSHTNVTEEQFYNLIVNWRTNKKEIPFSVYLSQLGIFLPEIMETAPIGALIKIIGPLHFYSIDNIKSHSRKRRRFTNESTGDNKVYTWPFKEERFL